VPAIGAEREFDGIIPIGKREGYRKNWALLIGINYTGRQEGIRNDPENRRALPELKNAANDAKAIASVLTTYYQYDPDAVVVLTDDSSDESDKPTAARILDELNKLCLPERIQPEDSVLFFFAGHGFKMDRESALNGNAVSLLPYDVTLSRGRPVGTNTLDLPDGLFNLVAKIPASNKLIVLDCCYSGEIFNARGNIAFQPRGEAANRSDVMLQREPTFQAIASCRATQVASDGRDGNSKFTTALLDGLKHIPARSDGADRERVWANRLLAYIRPNFDESQRPDCRNLIQTTGEFCFYPRNIAKFSEFALHDDEKSHLKALMVSRQGNWWFDEMPWFLPGIRSEIVKEHEKSQPAMRSANFSDLIQVEELKATAKKLIQDHLNTTDPLQKLRFRYAQDLMQGLDAKKLETTLQRIEAEMSDHLAALDANESGTADSTSSSNTSSAPPETTKTFQFAPEDIHFLAVVQHSLGKKAEAEATYDRAIKAYELVQSNDADGARPSLHILAALCRADHGEFLDALREPQKAAKEFSIARRTVLSLLMEQNRTEDSAAFFRIFMLCREADACLAMNRWSQANQLLIEAVDVAEALAPNHFLQAHVHRRRAWAKIIQWKIQDARCSFQRSNEILYAQFLREARDRGELVNATKRPSATDVAATVVAPDHNSETVDVADTKPMLGVNSKPLATCGTNSLHEELGPVFRDSTDHASKIAYLHNLHGIAMATRFHGDTLGSARYYRWLAGEVEDALTRFRDSPTEADLESQFIGRVINTQERLGDCNLFGNPEDRDLHEAIDDYRRAMDRVHLMRKWESSEDTSRDSDRQRASLLYKQALALSLPSAIQNTELALEMCRRADEVYKPQKQKATGLWQALGELTTNVVRCIHDSSQLHSTGDIQRSPSSSEELRRTILEYRDTVGAGTVPHRDQLELCLFASKVLLEHSGPQGTFQTMTDADLLLSFCRLALSPYSSDSHWNDGGTVSERSESRAYLRPYYDSVMRAKLRLPMKHVKDLLEIQAEATLGTYYIKREESRPVLATYAMSNDCYLIVDLPHGVSMCVPLTEMYGIETIREATVSSKQALPLPTNIHQALVEWRTRLSPSANVQLELRWEDSPSDAFSVRQIDEQSTESMTFVAKPIVGKFPFQLPDGFNNTLPLSAPVADNAASR